MAEVLSSKPKLVQELKARYGFVMVNDPDPDSLINKGSISRCVEEVFQDGQVELRVETKPYPILGFRDILATVTTASVDDAVVASHLQFDSSKIRGFVPRERYSLYRPGWLSAPDQEPVKIQVTEFVRGSQVLDFYLYTRKVIIADSCALGRFPLDLEAQQKIGPKLGIG